MCQKKKKKKTVRRGREEKVLCILTVVCDVHGGAKQLHQLLLIVLKVALHDVHTRTEETLKGSHIQYWGEDGRGSVRGWIG